MCPGESIHRWLRFSRGARVPRRAHDQRRCSECDHRACLRENRYTVNPVVDLPARILAGLSPYEAKGFDYPPLTPLIVLPVAWLPYPQARVVWLVANWLCLAAAGFP